MYDIYKRNIDYVRISVIDRCNYRCIYCMPEEGIQLLSHDEILSFEEIVTVVKQLASLGIKKIKLTGGEPLVRKDIWVLIKLLGDINGIEQITMTTNGYYLQEYSRLLYESGLRNINVSIDTLDKEEYSNICRRDGLDKVLSGIEEALSLGIKIKINATIAEYTSEDNIFKLLEYGEAKKIPIRFIEMMPIGIGEINEFVSDDVLNIVKKKYIVKSTEFKYGNGPANYYSYGKGGVVGFISAVHHKFCSTCNRIRMSADGNIRACLGHDNEFDLKPILRNKALKEYEIEENLKEVLSKLIYNKPCGHSFSKDDIYIKGSIKTMNKIGG